jgi:putative ABC transport system permease protein
MKNKKLNTFSFIFLNFKRKKLRTISMMVITAVLSFTIFGGWILSQSIEKGIDSTANRLGADIMVIPADSESSLEGALLKGEPSTFYLEEGDLVNRLKQVDGVRQISSQLYIATLSASCCSVPVQLIGIDIDTDFVVGSWVSGAASGKLEDGELIVGYGVGADSGATLRFYNRELTVKAKLSKTGMGYDHTVFMNMNTARMLMAETEAGKNSEIPVDDMASAIMVKLADDADVSAVQSDIDFLLGPDYQVLSSQSILHDVTGVLGALKKYISVLILILWVLIVIILNLMFIISLNERKKEFAILRVMGARRKVLTKLILTESSLICLTGALAGEIGRASCRERV